MKYAAVVHVIARSRSCYAFKEFRAPWLWLARLWARISFALSGYETEVYVMSDEVANEWLDNYRNWLGQKRHA